MHGNREEGMPDRIIILHYHMFKNAGTSVDRILMRNFPDRWVTAEFPMNRGNNTQLVEDWIRCNPKAIAFSSHSMQGPIPQIENVRVISVMLLRDPIDRIRSAYSFERLRGGDHTGPRLARENDFAGYIRKRLAITGDRQCRNFHTDKLAKMVPSPRTEIMRAKSAMDMVSVMGRVETFGGVMESLSLSLSDSFPHFTWDCVRENLGKRTGVEMELDTETESLLHRENLDDYTLLEALATHERHSAEILAR